MYSDPLNFGSHISRCNCYRSIAYGILLVSGILLMVYYQRERTAELKEVSCDIKYIMNSIESDHDYAHRFYCRYTIGEKHYKHPDCGHLPRGWNTCWLQGTTVCFHKPQ